MSVFNNVVVNKQKYKNIRAYYVVCFIMPVLFSNVCKVFYKFKLYLASLKSATVIVNVSNTIVQ